MINENQEHWLDKVNQNLEKKLDKANKENDIQIKMKKYYAMRNKIVREKLRKANAKIQALNKKEEEGRLDILVEASLHAQTT